jgi:hypothetical protein
MSRMWILKLAFSLGTISAFGMQAAPAMASAVGPGAGRSALVGVLGFEGGPYPGGFHPTSGSVEVEFTNVPLVLLEEVGPTGHFRINLGPGSYTVIGCGPSSSGGQSTCGKPQDVTLKAGEVDHIRLIWAYAP